MTISEQLERLNKLGLRKAHRKVEANLEFNRKMHIAYQNYEFVTKEDIGAFKKELRRRTTKTNRLGTTRYNTLVFIDIRDYGEVPPVQVLDRLEEATERKCFDHFEIAKIEERQVSRRVKDPILFARINGCKDHFFIAQWDHDVTFEMIKKVSKGLPFEEKSNRARNKI